MKVRIGHIDYPVVLEPEDSDEFGETMGTFHRDDGIELHPIQSPSEMATTLVHEIIHAIWATYRLPKVVHEEQACLRLEGPLLAFLRDNRGVVKALQDAAEMGKPLELEEAE